MRTAIFLGLAFAVLITKGTALAVDPYAGIDPYWMLLHEPAVVQELKLTPTQQQGYRAMLDELDLRFFPLRNKSLKDALAGQSEIVAEVREKLKKVLQSAQHKRLAEIQLRRGGPAGLLSDAVAGKLNYTAPQRERLQAILDETKPAVAALEKDLADGKDRKEIDQKYQKLRTDEYKQLMSVLKPEQQTAWTTMLGPTFDLSKLGQPVFKVPELIDSGEWINSPPLKLEGLRGKVVVVHFYAANCINCIHNYPTYTEWQNHFQGQEVVMIGIHTPETEGERDVAAVRKKAADAKFAFPVLIDGKQENWNAWGNAMWPSVYILDQRGYLRHFWPGELKWKGAEGDKFMRERIELLLAEQKR